MGKSIVRDASSNDKRMKSTVYVALKTTLQDGASYQSFKKGS